MSRNKKLQKMRLGVVLFMGLYWLSTLVYQGARPAIAQESTEKNNSAKTSTATSAMKSQDAKNQETKNLDSKPEAACLVEAEISGAIGPATLDFLQRAQRRVVKNKCGNLLLTINTPGGNLQSTRLIVENILNSPVPVLCLVGPSGAHAGSAGAIILLACHLSGALEATNIGAATPIASTGEKLPEDVRNKMINDTVAWVEGLARLRGRNEKYAKDIVVEAKAVTAKEALELKAIEFAGTSTQEFLKFAEGKKVKMNENTETTIRVGERVSFGHDFRFKIMDILMNPQIAYMLFMGSLALLYYEFTHPGIMGPGVVGAVGLVISLISLHMMDVTWGAVALIVLGIGFMIAEAFVAGFGMLGIGGVIAFFVGSLFLFDPQTSGYEIPLSTILPTTLITGFMMIGIAYLAFSTRKLRKHGGADDFVGRPAVVSEVHAGDGTFGYVEIDGELWRCTSDTPLKMGEKVFVLGNQGLTLKVTHNEQQPKES